MASSDSSFDRSRRGLRYEPLIVRTATISRARVPVAYDCVKVIVVRDGSAILFSEFGKQPVGHTEPAQVLRLGEDRAQRLMPWLDELAALSIEETTREELRFRYAPVPP
jgi:hypothetical protein